MKLHANKYASFILISFFINEHYVTQGSFFFFNYFYFYDYFCWPYVWRNSKSVFRYRILFTLDWRGIVASPCFRDIPTAPARWHANLIYMKQIYIIRKITFSSTYILRKLFTEVLLVQLIQNVHVYRDHLSGILKISTEGRKHRLYD